MDDINILYYLYQGSVILTVNATINIDLQLYISKNRIKYPHSKKLQILQYYKIM